MIFYRISIDAVFEVLEDEEPQASFFCMLRELNFLLVNLILWLT